MPKSSFRPSKSLDKQHDLLRKSLRSLDLSSNFKVDLLRTHNIFIDSSLRDKHDGAYIIYLS